MRSWAVQAAERKRTCELRDSHTTPATAVEYQTVMAVIHNPRIDDGRRGVAAVLLVKHGPHVPEREAAIGLDTCKARPELGFSPIDF